MERQLPLVPVAPAIGSFHPIIAFDPFRPEIPHKSLPLPSEGRCNISVSQGAFHAIVFKANGGRYGVRNALIVWRLEEDGERWTLQYEMALNTTTTQLWSSVWGGYELKDCTVLCLHPEKPEIVYFRYLYNCIFSCNLKTGTWDPEFFCAIKLGICEPQFRAFQPRVTCWPTPIPRYDELRGMYDGSYDCWVQSSSTTTLPPTIEECQPLVEQSGRRRKDKGPAAASLSKSCVRKKQKVGNGGLCPESGKCKLSCVIN